MSNTWPLPVFSRERLQQQQHLFKSNLLVNVTGLMAAATNEIMGCTLFYCKKIWELSNMVNKHFRCRVWQAQILDVIHCHLLLKHPCDVCKIIRHENTYWNLQWYACHLILKLLYVSYRLLPQPFWTHWRETIHLMRVWCVCSVTAW